MSSPDQGANGIEHLDITDIEDVAVERQSAKVLARRNIAKLIGSDSMRPILIARDAQGQSLLLSNLMNIWHRQLNMRFEEVEGLRLSEYLMGMNALRALLETLRVGHSGIVKVDDLALCWELFANFREVYAGFCPPQKLEEFEGQIMLGVRVKIEAGMSVDDYGPMNKLLNAIGLGELNDVRLRFCEQGRRTVDLLYRRLLREPNQFISDAETATRCFELWELTMLFDVQLDLAKFDAVVKRHVEDLASGLRILENLIGQTDFLAKRRELARGRELSDIWVMRAKSFGHSVDLGEGKSLEQFLADFDLEFESLVQLNRLGALGGNSGAFA